MESGQTAKRGGLRAGGGPIPSGNRPAGRKGADARSGGVGKAAVVAMPDSIIGQVPPQDSPFLPAQASSAGGAWSASPTQTLPAGVGAEDAAWL